MSQANATMQNAAAQPAASATTTQPTASTTPTVAVTIQSAGQSASAAANSRASTNAMGPLQTPSRSAASATHALAAPVAPPAPAAGANTTTTPVLRPVALHDIVSNIVSQQLANYLPARTQRSPLQEVLRTGQVPLQQQQQQLAAAFQQPPPQQQLQQHQLQQQQGAQPPNPAGAMPPAANGGQGLGAWPPAGALNGLATLALPPREAFAPPQDDGFVWDVWENPAKRAKPTPTAFMMGTSLPPVPGRVVAKIKARQFVDFAELLADNAELLRRESERDYGSPAWSRPQLRQVPTIIAWVQAFASFAAVELQLRPERAVELMAYLRLLVRETMRCGSEGWRQYDTQFRQQAAADPNIVWSTLNSGIHSSTFLYGANPKKCLHCVNTDGDHLTSQCALRTAEERRASWRATDSENAGSNGKTSTCRLYNYAEKGCHYQPCAYKHSCARCGKGHRARECKLGPAQGPAPTAPQVTRSAVA